MKRTQSAYLNKILHSKWGFDEAIESLAGHIEVYNCRRKRVGPKLEENAEETKENISPSTTMQANIISKISKPTINFHAK
ncbi:unnamed protein product [Mucor fragilis]